MAVRLGKRRKREKEREGVIQSERDRKKREKNLTRWRFVVILRKRTVSKRDGQRLKERKREREKKK